MVKERIPVTNGQYYTIEITGLGHSGEGVGRYENFTVFVEGALAGEIVEVKINTVKRTYAKGTLTKIITPAAVRTTPPCEYYDQCGGCQLQHMTYEGQLTAKEQQITDALVRLGKLTDPLVLPIRGAENPWYYRNKMQLPVGVDSGKLVMGCYARGSHRIVHTERCLIQHEKNNEIARTCYNIAKELGLWAYDEQKQRGTLRHVIGRVSIATGELMVILVTATAELPQSEDWVRLLREQLPDVVSIYQNCNPGKTNVIMGEKTNLLWGKEKIEDTIGSLHFSISPQSFFQVNNAQTLKLYNTALKYAELTGEETVIDVYCGAGTISLCLAEKAKHVLGIEIVEAAILDAKENAQRNHFTNVEFVAVDAALEMPKQYEQGLRPDVIVFDPPRSGCERRVLDSAAAMNPSRIVYVSCSPQSLARDLAYLQTVGYELVKVQPVDMFPMTSHVECVALLEKK